MQTTVSFHNLAAGGEAVGRDENNRTTFVPFAAPGDRALINVTREEKRFARGEIVELLESSEERVAPPCPYFGPNAIAQNQLPCGGCDWQHINEAAQLQSKRALVVEALRRIGRNEDADARVLPTIASPPYGYRNKAVYVGAENVLGFHARESHNLVDVEYCLIQRDENNAILKAAREAIAQGLAPAGDWKLAARAASNGESLAVVISQGLSPETWPRAEEFAAFMLDNVPSLVGILARAGEREPLQILAGRDWLEEEVDGLRFQVRGDGFFQINTPLAPTLFSTVLEMANVQSGDGALDLFCGVGLFGLGMARAGAEVWGLERSEAAVDSARGNATRNGLQARFLAVDVTPGMKKLPRRKWAVAVLDPPRSGAAALVPALLRLAPRRLVYVSCDPATLARDVAALGARYELKAAQPLDLFSQSAHVETVVLLERRD
ncbi:MAG TPA: 23S rRNA (uracil(1939)-C(5))-methyltransferase RlmD [Abditibacteriaceae bacterium]|jgi:23S rRNA (uracil1939-C5)-methyltransferase